jgi:hypothetical protein
MFSYENFIQNYLSHKKGKNIPKVVYKSITSTSSDFNSQKLILHNSTDFLDKKIYLESFIHSPKVPRLPSLKKPPKKFQNRSRSIDPVTEKGAKSSTASKPDSNNITSRNQEKFMNATQPQPYISDPYSFKPSSLNTKYQSNQTYIMKNLEKAKKYFPIQLERKLRTTSMSISHNPMSRLYSPQNFYTRKENKKEQPKVENIQRLESTIQITGKKAIREYVIKHNTSNKKYKDLYDHLISFQAKENIYKKYFEDIDKANKGYIVANDLKLYLTGHNISPDRVYKLFKSISNRGKILKKDFLAVCLVYEHNTGEPSKFKIPDESIISSLEIQLKELKEIFEFHAKNNKISKEYLQEINQFLNPTQDILKAESLVLTSQVDFSWFLRCVPYFLYMHLEFLNKTF